ncbi:hypothetical protein FNV43_RR19109 [Rhamnella rubrinervis]|uniref:Uncharacterized protein n=1 Tax=Rhamnella rubrinervis TaxID=2594499 RepID=A0A8K0E6F1_9ROSA|nr:hypothetical protein FNV43_RR19109 [Rhamnella rubrinervis]
MEKDRSNLQDLPFAFVLATIFELDLFLTISGSGLMILVLAQSRIRGFSNKLDTLDTSNKRSFLRRLYCSEERLQQENKSYEVGSLVGLKIFKMNLEKETRCPPDMPLFNLRFLNTEILVVVQSDQAPKFRILLLDNELGLSSTLTFPLGFFVLLVVS